MVLAVIKPLSSSGRDSQAGLYLKHSLQMFLPGRSFKETSGGGNVKTSVIRSQRQGGGLGARFDFVSGRPHATLCTMAKGLTHPVAFVLAQPGTHSARGSGNTWAVPTAPREVYWAAWKAGMATPDGLGPGQCVDSRGTHRRSSALFGAWRSWGESRMERGVWASGLSLQRH